MTTLSIAWRDRPFDGECHRHTVPFRDKPPTIVEALDTISSLPAAFRDVGEVRLNGDLIPRDRWRRVRPKAGGSMTIHLPIRGGGSGGSSGGKSKNPLQLAGTIGVFLAATAVSGGTLTGPLLAGAGIVGTSASIAAGVLGAGISVGGSFGTGPLQ